MSNKYQIRFWLGDDDMDCLETDDHDTCWWIYDRLQEQTGINAVEAHVSSGDEYGAQEWVLARAWVAKEER